MKNFKVINQSLWAGSSPNQTGETLTRENRIGVKSWLNRGLMLLITILTLGVGQMWAGTKRIYLVPNAWNTAGAKLWVHSWGGTKEHDAQFTTTIAGDDAIYYVDIPDDNGKYIFTRTSGASSDPWGKGGAEWARNTFAGDNGSKNCCYINSIGSDDAVFETLSQATVYFASTATNVYVNVNREVNTKSLWRLVTMTSTGKTFDGKPLYSGTFNMIFGGVGELQFKEDDDWGSKIISKNEITSSSTFDGKVWNGSAWVEYAYDHIIKSGSTVVWDLGNETPSYWPNVYMYKMHYVEAANYEQLTKIGNNQSYKTFDADTYLKSFLFINNNVPSWTDYRFTTDIPGEYCDIDGIALFTYPNTTRWLDGHGKLDWQVTTNAKKANDGVKIYFDNTDAKWSRVRLKYGTAWFNRASAADATLVNGTANLYVIEMPNDAYYEKYYLADHYGYTNYYSIERMENISNRINYQESDLSSDITFIPTSGSGAGTAGNPKVWTTTTISGHTRQVTLKAPSHGTITATYKDENSADQTKTATSASGDVVFNVAQTCNLTITSTAATGYNPATLKVNDVDHTSGSVYVVRDVIIVTANFMNHSYKQQRKRHSQCKMRSP